MNNFQTQSIAPSLPTLPLQRNDNLIPPLPTNVTPGRTDQIDTITPGVNTADDDDDYAEGAPLPPAPPPPPPPVPIRHPGDKDILQPQPRVKNMKILKITEGVNDYRNILKQQTFYSDVEDMYDEIEKEIDNGYTSLNTPNSPNSPNSPESVDVNCQNLQNSGGRHSVNNSTQFIE